LSKKPIRRSEKAGIFHFLREMGSALVMALIAIVYVVQAFKIPTGSMEDSLMVGDFLLGLKFLYGAPVLPFVYKKFPAVMDPKPGDVVIFKYPGTDKKDYIKRCVAGPGQTVEIQNKKLFVDGKEIQIPPNGKHLQNGDLNDPRITHFKPVTVPKKGDILDMENATTREFVFYKHLIKQENPRSNVHSEFQLYIDGQFANQEMVHIRNPYLGQEYQVPFSDIKFEQDDWTQLENIITMVRESFPNRKVEIRRNIAMKGNDNVKKYTVKMDNYFMLGDNRDNSMDSRYWGFLNRNFVKAKAFILYFSLKKEVPFWQLPLKIRWNRIGKLIRSWDGMDVTATSN
jgi:signal peptidase I